MYSVGDVLAGRCYSRCFWPLFCLLAFGRLRGLRRRLCFYAEDGGMTLVGPRQCPAARECGAIRTWCLRMRAFFARRDIRPMCFVSLCGVAVCLCSGFVVLVKMGWKSRVLFDLGLHGAGEPR